MNTSCLQHIGWKLNKISKAISSETNVFFFFTCNTFPNCDTRKMKKKKIPQKYVQTGKTKQVLVNIWLHSQSRCRLCLLLRLQAECSGWQHITMQLINDDVAATHGASRERQSLQRMTECGLVHAHVPWSFYWFIVWICEDKCYLLKLQWHRDFIQISFVVYCSCTDHFLGRKAGFVPLCSMTMLN